jgi:hypothetical protein
MPGDTSAFKITEIELFVKKGLARKIEDRCNINVRTI